MVLRVGDPSQAATGTNVGWPRWRLLLQHDRDRLLLFGLRCGNEIVHHLRCILLLRQQATDQALEQVTWRRWHRREVVRSRRPAALESVVDGRAHCLYGPLPLRC